MDLLNCISNISPKEFVKQNCSESFKSRIPENQWSGLLNQLMKMSPNADLIKINKSEEYKIEFLIQLTSNKMYITGSVTVEESSPNYILAMLFAPGGGNKEEGNTQTLSPSRKEPVGKVNEETINNIKDYLTELTKQNKFSGSVLVAKERNILLSEAYGFASKRFKVLNRTDTKFNLALIGKSFTAVAVLQLVEEGKIGIDDPIGKYLDYFPKGVAEKVTVRQLLTMSSGWGDYWDNEYYLAHKDELRTVDDYMQFIKDIPLEFEPGTSTKHSNTGYEVAGAIIEKASGMDYFDYIREKIIEPAGMLNTDAFDRDGPVENLAVGYTNMNPIDKVGKNFEWENTFFLSPRGTPAGGCYSTTEDMLKYDLAFKEGKLIGKGYVNFIKNGFKGKIGDPFVQKKVSRLAGGAFGASTLFARDFGNDYTIIVLTNYDHPIGIDVGNEIIKKLGLE